MGRVAAWGTPGPLQLPAAVLPVPDPGPALIGPEWHLATGTSTPDRLLRTGARGALWVAPGGH